MIAIPLACGLLTLLVVGAGFLLYRSLPRRWACPRCHHVTAPVTMRVLRHLRKLVQWRWCPRCHWSGLARGPEHRERNADARAVERLLESRIPGPERFRWGTPDRLRAPVFRWAGQETGSVPEPREKAAHPSGFHWGDDPAPDLFGFTWGEESEPGD